MWFMIIVGAIITVCVIFYLVFASKQRIPLKKIICEIKELPDCNEQLLHLVSHSIRKVNGWNSITSAYTVLHYALNTISISFSCISIYCSSFEDKKNSSIASIISLIAISLNLFLRCDRKWKIFHDTLAEARKLTFDYITDIKIKPDLNSTTKKYNEDIIKLEKDLNVSDIS